MFNVFFNIFSNFFNYIITGKKAIKVINDLKVININNNQTKLFILLQI